MLNWLCSFSKETPQPTVVTKEEIKVEEKKSLGTEELLREQLYQRIISRVNERTVFNRLPTGYPRDYEYAFHIDGNEVSVRADSYQYFGNSTKTHYYNTYKGIPLVSDSRLWDKCQKVYREDQERKRIKKLQQVLSELG